MIFIPFNVEKLNLCSLFVVSYPNILYEMLINCEDYNNCTKFYENYGKNKPHFLYFDLLITFDL